jgi:hypothetical protein
MQSLRCSFGSFAFSSAGVSPAVLRYVVSTAQKSAGAPPTLQNRCGSAIEKCELRVINHVDGYKA